MVVGLAQIAQRLQLLDQAIDGGTGKVGAFNQLRDRHPVRFCS